MPRQSGGLTSKLRETLRTAFGQPQVLAFLPAITLAAFWLGGEDALLGAALLLPVAFALAGMFTPAQPVGRHEIDGETGLPLRSAAVAALEDTLSSEMTPGFSTACLVVSIEGLEEMTEHLGAGSDENALRLSGERLGTALRGSDVLARLAGPRFAVALGPVRRADLESLLQVAGRLQDAVREPVKVDGTNGYLTCSIGFCLPGRSPAPSGEAMLAAAESATEEARAAGAGTIRAFTSEMRKAQAVTARPDLVAEVGAAIESGHIRPWFQPQISTDTGRITGFEALARWTHPDRGAISPEDFLPAIAEAGMSERLAEEMLFHAFTALRSWERAGERVPSLGVNFSGAELRNPQLADRIRWELDRFELAPSRLTVEILETVVTEADDDVVTRNIAALAELGCRIDLDDFGTGQASLAAIRRFDVTRLKIDRSFVRRVDQDRQQQEMVAAILTMGERLRLDTLAEGVENGAEHEMVAQLGCAHVQGYGISRPMPFEDTIGWIRKHHDKLAATPSIARRAG